MPASEFTNTQNCRCFRKAYNSRLVPWYQVMLINAVTQKDNSVLAISAHGITYGCFPFRWQTRSHGRQLDNAQFSLNRALELAHAPGELDNVRGFTNPAVFKADKNHLFAAR
jgi:hypothetical protein